MTYYIINTSMDYADEFDYPVISLMTAEERQKYIDTYSIWSKNWNSEIGFGTNEGLWIPADEALSLIEEAEAITKEKFGLIAPYLIQVPSVDITEDIVYVLDEY